jgi:hypothetical protein
MLVNNYHKSDIAISSLVFLVIYAILSYILTKMNFIPDNLGKDVIFTALFFALFYTLNKYISLTLNYQN